MSIDYEAKPTSAIKYSRLKSDVSKRRIKGLNFLAIKKGEAIPKGVDGVYAIGDGEGNYLTVYKLNKKGDALFSAYNLRDNDPFPILDKLAAFYKCDYIDRDGIRSRVEYV